MKRKICRADIAADLYEMCGERIGKEEAARIIDCVILKMKKELAEGNSIELRGFGSFCARKRAGKTGARNPKTGETLNVPPHYVAVFKPGSELKKAMREIKEEL